MIERKPENREAGKPRHVYLVHKKRTPGQHRKDSSIQNQN